MAEKTYFELLQEQAAQARATSRERGPELTVGPQRFTIIGGATGTKDGRDWAAVVARHTNGHEYRIFYNLYWPLGAGELTPRLNTDVFNWIVSFDNSLLQGYTSDNFNDYFNKLAGRQFEVNYTVSKNGKIVPDFKTPVIETNTPEEEVLEIDFSAIE